MIKKGLTKHEFIEKEFLKELEWNSIPPDRSVWSQRDWDETLVTKITMLSNIIHHKTHQGGADTIRLGSEAWMMGLPEYITLLNTDAEVVPEDTLTIKVGNLCGRWWVFLDENVPHNEIWVSREQPTYGIILEDTEGDAPTIGFNYDDMFDKKKLRGRIKING
jgi:hypothetical protein